MFDIDLNNLPLYFIKDVNNCYFVKRNLIYNTTTKRYSKLKERGGVIGFNINSKFTPIENIIKVEKLSKNL